MHCGELFRESSPSTWVFLAVSSRVFQQDLFITDFVKQSLIPCLLSSKEQNLSLL